MSQLAQQLNKLKQYNVLSIAPGAPKPTLILNQQTARCTTIDVLLTMAIIGYGQIKKQLLQTARYLVQQLLSQDNKQINRNQLTKQENRALSIKLTNLLLLISPLFLNRGCQSIIQYLLRNYNIHIYQSQQLALIYLQYWQHQPYKKLLKNIQIKTPNLQFLKKFKQKQPINLSYIIKSITYSRSLIYFLITLIKKYIKYQNIDCQQIQIQLQKKPTTYDSKIQSSTIIKHDPKSFLLTILTLILQKNITNFNKQLCQLCIFCSKQHNQDVSSMTMILAISILTVQANNANWIHLVLKNLVNTNDQLTDNLFYFIMVIWQRWPTIINHDLISILITKQRFAVLLTNIKKSIHMVFLMLLQYFLQPKQSNKGPTYQIIQTLCLRVKQQQFVKSNQTSYFTHIFNVIHQNYQKLQKNQKKTLLNFIKNFLLYEYSLYLTQYSLNPIQDILTKQYLNKNGTINISLISRVQQKINKSQQLIEHRQPIQQISSQNQQHIQINQKLQNNQNSTILAIINSSSNTIFTKFDLNQPQLKNITIKLIDDYYTNFKQQNSSKLSLTTLQKNRILQNPSLFNEVYNLNRFYYDLQKQDFNTCIRFILINGNTLMCYKVLIKLTQNKLIYDDLIYRQLCRQAIQKLSQLSINNYASVVKMLGKLYHSYCKYAQADLMLVVNEKMLKLSTTVITSQNRRKGKYYKLISCHSKLLSKLILSQTSTSSYALQTYQKLLNIFGTDNTYCFLIGLAQLLAKIKKNQQPFGNFINTILIPSLSVDFQQLNQSQLLLFRNIFNLFKAFNKCLIFCFYMLRQSQSRNLTQEKNANHNKQSSQDNTILSAIESGVAKTMLTNFFGIKNSKQKKIIMRKILLLLSEILISQKFKNLFKQTLQVIKKKQQNKLTSITSKIYSILVTISNKSNGHLKQVIQLLKSNILALFPLQQKINVLGPLLPLTQAYKQLSTSLQHHSTYKFENLDYFVNIVPKFPTNQWYNFTKQCIKRGYSPTQQTCKQILQLSKLPHSSLNIIQFICNLSQYNKQKSLNILNQIMTIIITQCKQLNNYTLAIFYTLIKNLKQFIHPYLSQIFSIAIQIQSQHINQFIDAVIEHFTAPTLITITKTHSKTVKNYQNFTYFLSKLSHKISFDPLWKTTQNFFSQSLSSLVQQQKPFNQLHLQQSQIFQNQALKMNDNQLRKIILDYIRWVSQRTNSDNIAHLHFNSRKHLLLTIFIQLSNKLGDLFTNYYGYIFQDIIKDLQSLSCMQQSKTNLILSTSGKRSRQISQYGLQCCANYLNKLLNCLNTLFMHDQNNQFMDSIKFDTLSPELANVFNMVKFDQHYHQLINDNLKPCLISLFKHTSDDYKLKTISTQILKQLRTKNQQIIHQIFNFYKQLAHQIQYRFLLLTDQMIPLLIQASSNRNHQIKKSVQSIIYHIQNLSGVKIYQIHR